MMKNAINWFEISVGDFNRAKKFYETIFDYQMHAEDFTSFKMGFLPARHQSGWPSAEGTMVYLNANPDLTKVLNRVQKAEGKVISPKKQISPEYGYMAMFLDSEGNKVALHSQK